MFDNIIKLLKKFSKEKDKESKDAAKERLHLVLMQDRANVSADFMELMKQEIIEVIKKYIEVDENSIDVKLTNKINTDGTTGAPTLYANIPILNIKDEAKQINIERKSEGEEKPEGNKKEEQEKVEEQNNKKEEQPKTVETKQEKEEDKSQNVKEKEQKEAQKEPKKVQENNNQEKENNNKEDKKEETKKEEETKNQEQIEVK